MALDDREAQALIELLERARRQLAEYEAKASSPIAVTGLACRLPGGANDELGYWRLLRERGDAVREVPKDRWDIDRYYDPNPDAPGKMATRFGGFLQDVDVRAF